MIRRIGVRVSPADLEQARDWARERCHRRVLAGILTKLGATDCGELQ